MFRESEDACPSNAFVATNPDWPPVGVRMKRIMDVVFSVTLIVLISPLFAIIALLVILDSRGPVLFRQRRTGFGGRVFNIYKFRTMSVVEDGEVIAHATRGDARITRTGAVLRRYSLDELPQLFNVCRGEMSLVGPRPHAVSHDLHYSLHIPQYPIRFATKPGLTGLAQVRGLRGEIRGIDCMRARVSADQEYIAAWSLRLDMAIMLKTIPKMLGDRAAF